MAKGGARARSGPPPDPLALRRDRPSDGDWTTLPAEGRQGKPPTWPLCRPTVRGADGKELKSRTEAIARRERALWAREWKRPQAVMWERLGLEVTVALYVRTLADAEKPDAPNNRRTLVKQLQEELGISLPGLARNRWRIGEVAQPAPPRQRTGRSARERFTLVAGGRDG